MSFKLFRQKSFKLFWAAPMIKAQALMAKPTKTTQMPGSEKMHKMMGHGRHNVKRSNKRAKNTETIIISKPSIRRLARRGGVKRISTSPPAGGDRSLYSDATRIRRSAARHGEAGRPGWARPGRGWPDSNARATRTTRREREPEGRRLQRERPPPKP